MTERDVMLECLYYLEGVLQRIEEEAPLIDIRIVVDQAVDSLMKYLSPEDLINYSYHDFGHILKREKSKRWLWNVRWERLLNKIEGESNNDEEK